MKVEWEALEAQMQGVEAGKNALRTDSKVEDYMQLTEGFDALVPAYEALGLQAEAIVRLDVLLPWLDSQLGKSQPSAEAIAPDLLDDAKKAWRDAKGLVSSDRLKALASAKKAEKQIVEIIHAMEETLSGGRLAWQAGVESAEVLLGLASGSGIHPAQRAQVQASFERLSFSENPLAALPNTPQPYFGQAAEALATKPLEALRSERGEGFARCFAAGYHMAMVRAALHLKDASPFLSDLRGEMDQLVAIAEADGWPNAIHSDLVALRDQIKSARGELPADLALSLASAFKQMQDPETGTAIFQMAGLLSTGMDKAQAREISSQGISLEMPALFADE